MDNEALLKDGLTNIHNETFLKREYDSYRGTHPEARLIMIDFKKFKLINDNYSHEMGDICLRTFAQILDSTFDDSIVVRLHGDEYCVVTSYTEEDIVKLFQLVNNKIASSEASAKLGRPFEFNAGICPAGENLDETRDVADFVMYHAKNHGKNFDFFSDEIWAERVRQDEMTSHIEEAIKDKSITYYGRRFYKANGVYVPSDIQEINSRDKQGGSLITSENYELLKEKSLLKKLDIYNLDTVFRKLVKNQRSGRVLLNYDINSLLAKPGLIEYMELMIDLYKINPSSVILSINMNGIDPKRYNEAVTTILDLKRLGFKICSDKVTSMTPDAYIIDINPQYLKFDPKYIESTLHSEMAKDLLALKLSYLSQAKAGGITPMFTCVRSQGDLDHIVSMTKKVSKKTDVLVDGDFIEQEKRVK